MFRKLIEKIRSFSNSKEPIDPSIFNDPVADKTDWSPIKSGGTNFCTHYLKEMSIDRIEFKASVRARIFYLFLLIGGTTMLTCFAAYIFNNGISSIGLWTSILLLAGLCWTVFGGRFYIRGTKPIVFDKVEGYFWKGKKSLYKSNGINPINTAICFEEIYAIQLITEHCHNDEDSFESYEMNLVLNNAKRISIVDHGNLDYIHCDARTLSRFLEKPLWNAL